MGGLSDDPVLIVRGPPNAAQPLPDQSDGARPASPSLPVRPLCDEGHREPPRQPGHPLTLPWQHEGRQRRHWLDETWGRSRAQRDGGVTDIRHVRDDHLQAAARRGQRLPEPEAVFRGGFRLHRPGTISRGLCPYPLPGWSQSESHHRGRLPHQAVPHEPCRRLQVRQEPTEHHLPQPELHGAAARIRTGILKSYPDRVVKPALVDNLQWGDGKEQEKTSNSPWSSTSSSSSWSSTEDSSVQPGCSV